MKLCTICNYHQAQEELCSMLGDGPACFDCVENRAERPISIHVASQRAYKLEAGNPERVAIIKLLKRVTCWRSEEEGYMPLAEYEQIISKQMPTVITEDDIMARKLAERLEEVRQGIEDEKKADKGSKDRWFFAGIVSWFRGIGAEVRYALDSGL